MSRQTKYYLFLPPDVVVGPHSFDVLREWIAVGALSEDSQVCEEGTEAWMHFSGLPRNDSLTAAIQRRIDTRRSHIKGSWQTEPATRKQIAKLEYFAIPFEIHGLTKARASELLDCFVSINPSRENQYQSQSASEEQSRELESLGLFAEGLSHFEAKALAYETRIEERRKFEENVSDFLTLDHMVNNEEVLELCLYRTISQPNLERLLIYLNCNLPNWKARECLSLGRYVARNLPAIPPADPVFRYIPPDAHKLMQDQPPYWQYALTQGLLSSRLPRIWTLWKEAVDGQLSAIGNGCGTRFAKWHKQMMQYYRRFLSELRDLCTDHLNKAWQRAGKTNDAQPIISVVDKIGDICGSLAGWEAEVKTLLEFPRFRHIEPLMKGYTHPIFDLVDQLESQLKDQVPVLPQTKELRIRCNVPAAPQNDALFAALEKLANEYEEIACKESIRRSTEQIVRVPRAAR